MLDEDHLCIEVDMSLVGVENHSATCHRKCKSKSISKYFAFLLRF